MDMPIHPGDPLTPGTASEPGVARLDRTASPTILKIPVLPISYGDALPLLKNLKGPIAPEDWRGSLPITYHVGAGPAKVHMKLAFDWSVRRCTTSSSVSRDRSFPDEWIVHGNHHDAWVNGAADPTSGQVALMETARGLGELLKTGWRRSGRSSWRRGTARSGAARIDGVGREARAGAARRRRSPTSTATARRRDGWASRARTRCRRSSTT
jgi:N-acetylated-alpha-linked acidic dipeptidase